MTTDEYIYNSFVMNFSKFKNKNIVLYGVGMYTKMLINKFPEHHFIGLMDVREKYRSQSCHGKKIFSFNDLIEYQADMIIIVTRKENLEEVYLRLRDFCLMHQLPVYYINGKNLFEWFGERGPSWENIEYSKLSESKMREQIDNHEVISFDLFDTLVMRKCLSPTDVWRITNDKIMRKGVVIPDFLSNRQKSGQNHPLPQPNIYGIYNYLQTLTEITDADKQIALQTEIAVEKSLIIPRKKMVEIFQYAIEQGKRIFIITNMSLPEAILKDILKSFCIQGYEKLYVSCEYKKTKQNGLFNIMMQETGKELTYLHIGNEEEADYLIPKSLGIDCFLIKSAYDIFKISSYHALFYKMASSNEASLLGLFISRIFNNPFCLSGEDGKTLIGTPQEFAYLFISPLVVKYFLWLIAELSKKKYQDILFFARDGYIFEKLYHFVKESLNLTDLPKGTYFFTSRKAAILSSLSEESDIKWFAEYINKESPEECLKNRFCLPEESILTYDTEKYKDFIQYVLAHKDAIKRISSESLNGYKSYEKSLELKDGEEYAIFDFCSKGLTLNFLQKTAKFKMTGLYFCKYVNDLATFHVNAYGMIYNRDSYFDETYFFEWFTVLEAIFTSYQPALKRYFSDGSFEFEADQRSDKHIEFVKETQNAIEEYCHTYFADMHVIGEEIEYEFVDLMFHMMDEKFTNYQVDIFKDVKIINNLNAHDIPIKNLKRN